METKSKVQWKHAFKRTTSDSKRGLIKKILNLMNTSHNHDPNGDLVPDARLRLACDVLCYVTFVCLTWS